MSDKPEIPERLAESWRQNYAQCLDRERALLERCERAEARASELEAENSKLRKALQSRHLEDLIADAKYRRRTQARWMRELRDAALGTKEPA